MLYKPLNSEEDLLKIFKKLKPIPYNRFFWWRLYKNKKEPLKYSSPLIDKIKNGDFNYSHYRFQAEWVEHQINKIWESTKPDIGKFNEASSLLRTRRKRLLEDFDKDEKQKLEDIRKEFCKLVDCSKEQVKLEMESYDNTLEKFYYYMINKYKRENIMQNWVNSF